MSNINKITKDIKIKKNKAGKIIFRLNDCSINWIEELILCNLKKLNKFYKAANPKINIELIYSRKEFNSKIGRKTPKWMVGVALKNKIYLFSPLVIEKFSSHKKSELNKIIVHELCHIFNQKINKEILTWVDEGIALFLAGQKKLKCFKKSDWYFFVDNFLTKNINFQSFVKYNGYKISYWAVKAIAKKFNKSRLLDLIRINAKKNDCRDKLEKIFGVSTEDFSKILCFKNKTPALRAGGQKRSCA